MMADNEKSEQTVRCSVGAHTYMHIVCDTRRLRFLRDVCHRGACPLCARGAAVFRLAFVAGGEDCQPEGVLEHEGGRGELCAA